MIFSSFREELEAEIGIEKYEILDSIFMAFDSYEPNEKIRASEKYCIDEVALIGKVKEAYEKISRD